MKFIRVTILSALIAIACVFSSFGQSEQIYSISIQPEDIPSAEFKKLKPETLINEAKSLAVDQPDSALHLVSKALLISQKLELPNWEAQSFRRMGIVFLQNNKLPSAIHYLHRSEELFEAQKSTKDLRIIYNNLGVAYQSLGKNQKAIDYYFKSLEQAEIEENVEKQLVALSNLGDLSIQTNQFKTGKEFLQKGIDLSNSEKEFHLMARMQSQLGIGFIHLKDFEQAEAYLKTAQKHYESIEQNEENKLALASIYNGFGLIAKNEQEFELADEYYKKAINIYQETKSSEILVGWTNRGSLALAKKEFEKATFFFQKALFHPEFHLDALREKDLYLNLSMAYGKMQEVELANKYQYAYALLTDSIYEAEIKETASRAELLYTKARSERKEEEARIALERQQTLSNYLIGALCIAALIALIFYLFMRNYAQRKEALRKELVHKEESNKLLLVEMLKDHEVENLNAMLDGQENERKRIARDLHDSLGGTLAAVQLTLASLNRKLPTMQEAAQKTFDQAENLLDQAYKQMRGISHNLVDLSLKDGGLSPALGQLKETLTENTHIDIHMNYESLGSRRLDSNVEQHSYRITQELFQNIIKHAEASQIEYELNYSPVKLQISIQDDGKGFEYQPGNKVPGIGLNNILTRVRQLDGEMDIQTEPGKGTRIEVDIPLVLS